MLIAVNGYIDGNRVIVDENIADWQGRNVVVTILDSLWNPPIDMQDRTDDESRRNAASELAGLWKDYCTESSVEEMVRNMRRRRHFDT